MNIQKTFSLKNDILNLYLQLKKYLRVGIFDRKFENLF